MHTHKDVVTEYYAGFNRRDPDIYARLFTKDCELIAPGLRLNGPDALREFDRGWTSAFADGRIENLHLGDTDGAVLASNWFHGGKHVQPLQTPAGSIPASGRNFQVPYSAMFEFDGGRIKTQRITFDADVVPALLGAPGRATRSHASASEVVVAIYEAFGRGDLASVLNRIDPRAELQFEGPSGVPWIGTFRGRDGWTTFFQTLGGHLDEIKVTMEVFAAEGERVAASGRYQGRVKATGARIDSPLVHLWTVRDGLVVRCVELTNTAAEVAACTATK